MRILLTTLLLVLTFNISLAQSGWGYVNYTSYRTHAGNGNVSQYPQFANNAAGFDVMFNTANSNTTIFRTGEVTLAAMADGSSTVPRWANDYFGYKFEFWFIPQETGTYRFGINSDDASDLFVNGTVVSTYYGGHGASAYQYGNINLVAGTRYYVVARMQEYGGGEAFLLRWSRPSAPNTYSYWINEVTNIASEPTKKVRINFDFNAILDRTKFLVGSALSSTGWVDVTNMLDSNKILNGNLVYKPQSVKITTTNTLSILYNNILTVSDVYLAFRELQNGGIFGNETGNEFTYGIQYKNADVNDDGYFNEADCFTLLQHLTGNKNLVDTFNLRKTLKIIPISTYNTIGKSNWTAFPSYLGDNYNFDINTGKAIDTFYLATTWKGDVNLSHSTQQTPNIVAGNSIGSMNINSISTSTTNQINAYIITEIVNDSVCAYITIDPLQQELVGTQFKLNYDNTLLQFNSISYKTKGSPTNYGTNKGDYVNFGSLITDGGILDNTTEYKIIFKPQTKLNNVLGLISISFTDAVNKSGNSLKVIMK
jgi:hypothetical protein